MTGRRLPIVLLLIALLVAAIVVGNRHVPADAGVQEAAVSAAIPAGGARSSAWYCAGGPVGTGPSADQVTMSNTGSRSVRVAVDVLVAGHDMAEHAITVSARSSRTLRVASLSKSPSAAVVVQPLGNNVVVAQGYAAEGDVATVPCATRASSSWYFAAGSSVRGAQTSLSLLNPFAVDATVDIVAYTENGIRAPGTLQALDVPHESRLVVRLDHAVAEQRIVAVAVNVRNGFRIVAAQSLVQPASDPGSGVSISLGAFAPAHSWMFADNRSQTNSIQQLVLADPGEVDATARVAVVADVASVIEPRVVHIPASSAVVVDFSGVVPAGVNYTLAVTSPVPVVAETRDTFSSSDPFPGLVTEVGSTMAARRWSFAGGPVAATGLGGAGPRVEPGSDLAVVMDLKASNAQISNVRHGLEADGHVQTFHTVTQADALANFRRSQRDNPTLAASASKSDFPVVIQVATKSAAGNPIVSRRIGARAGVDQIVSRHNQPPVVADDVVVMNPGAHAVRVSLLTTAARTQAAGAGMTSVPIAPGRAVTISLIALAHQGAAVVANATGPVVAERFIGRAFGVTRSPGVPWLPD